MSWAYLNRAERDAAYNNALAVPNSQVLIGERNTKAAAFRALHAAHLDLPYAPAERTKWDIFPARDHSSPCLIFIHGGYWQMNRREDFSHFAAGVGAHGWSVAMPGYTLAPEASLHGAAHGLGEKFILCGWSAGGQLTAMLLDHPLVTAAFVISGVYELGPLRDTYLNEKLALSDEEVANLSPLRLAPVQKPLAIAYGTAELPALVTDSRDLHALRAAAHAPGILLPVPQADHFTILNALEAPDGAITKALLDLE
jgi:arylformamidase